MGAGEFASRARTRLRSASNREGTQLSALRERKRCRGSMWSGGATSGGRPCGRADSGTLCTCGGRAQADTWEGRLLPRGRHLRAARLGGAGAAERARLRHRGAASSLAGAARTRLLVGRWGRPGRRPRLRLSATRRAKPGPKRGRFGGGTTRSGRRGEGAGGGDPVGHADALHAGPQHGVCMHAARHCASPGRSP